VVVMPAASAVIVAMVVVMIVIMIVIVAVLVAGVRRVVTGGGVDHLAPYVSPRRAAINAQSGRPGLRPCE
jgi:hypothetical protein